MAVWKWIVETAATWTAVGIWIRLLFSLAVGMFIGIDRGLKRRGAGIRRMCWSARSAASARLVNICSDISICKSGHGADGRAGYQRRRIFRSWHDHGNRA